MEERGKTYEGDDEAVCRAWIEDVLGKKLEGDSLLECLRSGVALCEVLKVLNPSFKCKISASSMPFPQVQAQSFFFFFFWLEDIPRIAAFLSID